MKIPTAVVLGAFCLAVALHLTNAQGQSPDSNAAASWLVPSDALIARAIEQGFSGKKLPKDARYHTYRSSIKPAVDSQIELIPPIFCAEQAGQTAHDKLESKPDLEAVKRLCLDLVTVEIVHYSQALDANWPCVFQKGDLTVQPLVKRPDKYPQVANYYGGLFAGDVVGYRYIDIYTFQFPIAMVNGASLTYADETGQHHTLTYDFLAFVKDVPFSGESTAVQAQMPSDATKQTIVSEPEAGKSSTATATPIATPAPGPLISDAARQPVLANSEAGKSSPAAAAALADVGHVLTAEEMAGQVRLGHASKCAVITTPPGADIYIDGNRAGASPMAFVLLRKGDAPRVITIKMSGYKTVEKKVVPDGKIIPLGLILEKAM